MQLNLLFLWCPLPRSILGICKYTIRCCPSTTQTLSTATTTTTTISSLCALAPPSAAVPAKLVQCLTHGQCIRDEGVGLDKQGAQLLPREGVGHVQGLAEVKHLHPARNGLEKLLKRPPLNTALLQGEMGGVGVRQGNEGPG